MSQHHKLSLDPDPGRSSPKRSGRILGVILLVLLLAGGGAWFWLGQDRPQPDAVEDILTRPGPEQDPDAGQGMSLDAGEDEPMDGLPGSTEVEPDPAADDAADDRQSGSSDVLSDQEADQSGEGMDEADGLEELPGEELPGSDADHLDAASRDRGQGRVTRGLLATDPDGPVPSDLAGRGDAIVRGDFVNDLARWMVAGYVPANGRGGRGSITIGIQQANARYGVSMTGLTWAGDDLETGRAEVFRYVYTPSMLDALYRMYIDRFMRAMAEAAATGRPDGTTLDAAQVEEMYKLYARRFRSLSETMQGIAAISDLRSRLNRIHTVSEAMVVANSRYMEEVFRYDQARAGEDEAAIERARVAMEASSDTYQQATHERDRQREALIGAIRNNPEARGLGDDNLLYVAMWVGRRMQQSPQAIDATLQAATLFLDLAQRFEQAAARQ